MRFFFRFLKWTVLLIFLSGLAFAAWPWNVVLKEKIGAAPFRDYLEQNVQRIDLSTTDPEFEFEPGFYDSKLYLVGEAHGAQKALDFDLALMKHLNQRVGLRWLMAELSYVQAERFNAFLDTGDETFLNPIFARWLSSQAQWGNQQHYDKILALRAYNLTQPVDRRLRFFGVDRIGARDRNGAGEWLAGMLKDLPTDAPGELIALRDAAGAFDSKTFSDVAQNALAQINETKLNDYGIDGRSVVHLTRNLLLSLESDDRYASIIPNVDAMVRQFGIGDDEPIYGFWGLFHTMKAVINDTGRPLALRLSQSDYPFADGITSLVMMYTDSKMNMPSRALPEFIRSGGPFTEISMSQDNPYLLYTYGISDLKTVAQDSDIAIFSLYTSGSPYAHSNRLRKTTGIFARMQPLELTPPDQNPAEYIVLINGSPALTPWQPNEK